MGAITRTLANNITTGGVILPSGINNTSISNITTLPAGVGGKVLQVVSANKTDAFSTTSTSFVDVTGLSVSITPSSSSNKIYIVATVYMSSEDAPNHLTLLRNSSRIQSFQDYADYSTSGAFGSSMSCSYLDSPSTTSATTYKLQILSNSGNNAKVNQRWDSGSADFGDSTITVMEIEA